MENLTDIRNEIDKVDDELLALWLKRMELSKEVAENKKATGKKVTDSARENEIVYRLAEKTPEELRIYLKEVYSAIFATGKAYQSVTLSVGSPTIDKVNALISAGLKDFPTTATVACQGVSGSNSEAAAKRVFPSLRATYFKTFEGVFSAVDKGLCKYGVLPIENSNAGSVIPVYDLMKKYNFHIVRAVRLQINHALCAVGGATMKDIKTVYSHPQALSQCAEFIKKAGLNAVEAENTATAAKELAERGVKSEAVLCSVECAEKYGLNILERSVQDNAFNYTRFIVISKDLELYPESDKISVLTSLSHEPGSLNRTLARFAALGLNLTKIESRPISGTEYEFMFYFDFEGSVVSKNVQTVIAELENGSDNFVLLGSYKEVL